MGYTPEADRSVLFELTSLEVPAGGAVTVKALPAEHGVELRNETSEALRPVLEAHWSDDLSGHHGTNRFGLPELAPGAVQRLLVQDWPLVTQLRVETDLDRDGTPDLVDTPWAESVAALAVEATPDGQQLTLGWPLTAGGWQLESAPAVDGTPERWSPVMPPYQTNANRISLTLPIDEGQRLFRLRHRE